MREEFLSLLRCPISGESLRVSDAVTSDGRIRSGTLVSTSGEHQYPIERFVPRFVERSNYADNFGVQWNRFRMTQLDSHSGHPISAQRFWRATGWKPDSIRGRWVLDVGCGAGRFAEIALAAGAKVVAVDFSSAVDACYANLGAHPDLHVVQANLYALPFSRAAFPFVYSLGVLQHTPDVRSAFAALAQTVEPGGRLCADFYWKRIRTLLHAKYLVRPLTRRMDQSRLLRAIESSLPVLLGVSGFLGRIPVVGSALKRAVPVADYRGRYPLSEVQRREWALLDTFDMLAPKYDSPQSARTIRRWMSSAGFDAVEVLHANLLVVRGRKLEIR